MDHNETNKTKKDLKKSSNSVLCPRTRSATFQSPLD